VVSHDAREPPGTDSRSLAASLEPVLAEACQGRLGKITWFKADWQRGGAATGTAELRLADGGPVPVVIKLPVVPRELYWTRRLQNEAADEPVVGRLYASGETLGGYDLAWMAIERFAHGPLGLHWHEQHIPRIADAAARFHAAAAAYPIDSEPKTEPWDDLLRDAQESVKLNEIAETQRWQAALKALRRVGDRLIDEWQNREVGDWLHGDLHLANAMSRASLESGPVSLIDLAEIHAGHWVEDAVYLERQLWAAPDRMRSPASRPVKRIATARRKLGLTVADDYPRLAMIRRALLAGTAPKYLKTEGHPRYLKACLDQLERALRELK